MLNSLRAIWWSSGQKYDFLKSPFFYTHSLKEYNPEYLNMLSICCGLVPVCVFGKGFCGWQTDKLEKSGGERVFWSWKAEQ